MNINWFPGHMTKSLRMMNETIPLVDFLVYVLDARAPKACMNPAFEIYTSKLPVVYVLNKSDLADAKENVKWKNKLNANGNKALCLDSTRSGSAKPIIDIAKTLCADILKNNLKKGVRRVLRCMIIGVPNCGKSTLINNLCGRTKVYAENRAGVTRGKQWVKVGNYFEVLDTPGTLYPKIENQVYARHLAYIGSIKDEVLDKYDLACCLFDELRGICPQNIEKRYGFSADTDTALSLQQIALKRGFLLSGSVPDTEKAAIAFIDDFRKGRLGAVTLEKTDEND